MKLKNKNIFLYFLIVIVIIFVSFPSSGTGSISEVTIITMENVEEPIKFGILSLKDAFGRKGIKVNLISLKEEFEIESIVKTTDVKEAPNRISPTNLFIIIGNSEDAIFNSKIIKKYGIKLPEVEESYSIEHVKINSNEIIVIAGKDEVGVMYGELDLSDEINLIDKEISIPISQFINEKSYTPYIKLRGVNIFIHRQAIMDDDSWFFSEEFWAKYLDTLATTRHNFLDMHAMYDIISTGFPNAYPYFIKSDKFPNIGLSDKIRERNLKMLNKIVKMAKDRGIKTGFMSYKADWTIPDAEATNLQKPTEDKLVEYTKEVVKKMIEQCPDLWIIGFRIGESGMSEDFYKKSYIPAISSTNRPILLYTRTWLTQPEDVLSIVEKYPYRTYLQIKYNGEHLGLPYHAINDSSRVSAPSYSYESYTNYPRKYEIIWQIRANGTHRIFRWGDPEFIKRTIISCKNFNGSGYTVEPMTAYYPFDDFFHLSTIDHKYFKWDFERNWFWYLLWGRMGYNPDTDKRIWISEFEKRFGKEFGILVAEAFIESSKIVPLIYAFRCMGFDHRQMAPELEFGDDINEFINALPLDPRNIQTVSDYVKFYISKAKFQNTKMTPLEVAINLLKYSSESVDKVLKSNIEKGNKEFECLKMDIQAVAQLGMYYAEKILASIDLTFYRKKNCLSALLSAEKHLTNSKNAWDKLAEITSRHYKPFLDKLRMHTLEYSWKEEGKKIEDDFKVIGNEKEIFTKFKNDGKNHLFHIPVNYVLQSGVINFKATFICNEQDKTIKAFYKGDDDASDYKSLELNQEKEKSEFIYSKALSASNLGKREIYYFIEAICGNEKLYFPDRKDDEKIKKHIIDIITDTEKPIVKKVEYAIKQSKQVQISAEIEDNSTKVDARLFYKPIPSTKYWSAPIAMTAIENTNKFTAEVPFSDEGILFYLEAVDEDYNGIIYPDFRQETPYFIVEKFKK